MILSIALLPFNGCPPSLLYFFSIFDPMEAGRCFLWPRRQLFVPFKSLTYTISVSGEILFRFLLTGTKGGVVGKTFPAAWPVLSIFLPPSPQSL